MGFGLDSIGGAIKSAVHAVGDVAKKVESGAGAVEKKVEGAVKGAWEGLTSRDGFDDKPGLGPLAESKPKGGGSFA